MCLLDFVEVSLTFTDRNKKFESKGDVPDIKTIYIINAVVHKI